VLKKDAKLSEKDVIAAAAKHLSKVCLLSVMLSVIASTLALQFKLPERVFITDSIPKTATGKVQRRHMGPTFRKVAEKEGSRAKL
jgi:acyl-CoA synthetase (AMP-forming)/AMP-acid ligase II